MSTDLRLAVANRPGTLARACDVLAEAGVENHVLFERLDRLLELLHGLAGPALGGRLADSGGISFGLEL